MSLTLPGPVRAFCIGPRVLEELTSAGPPEQLTERLLARIRAVQYSVEAESYYPASVLQASSGEEVARALGCDTKSLRPVMKQLIAGKRVKAKGKARGMRYTATKA